jgi:ABC-type dipeptide/oligopeptide/nickel transport system ATPase component
MSVGKVIVGVSLCLALIVSFLYLGIGSGDLTKGEEYQKDKTNELTIKQINQIAESMINPSLTIHEEITQVIYVDMDRDQKKDIVVNILGWGESSKLVYMKLVSGKWRIISKTNHEMGDWVVGKIEKDRMALMADECHDNQQKYKELCIYELKNNRFIDTFVNIDPMIKKKITGINRDKRYIEGYKAELLRRYYSPQVKIRDTNRDGNDEIPVVTYNKTVEKLEISWFQFKSYPHLVLIKKEQLQVHAKKNWRNNQMPLQKNPKYSTVNQGLGEKDKRGRTPLSAVTDMELAIAQKNISMLEELAIKKTDVDFIQELWDYDGGKKGDLHHNQLYKNTMIQMEFPNKEYVVLVGYANDKWPMTKKWLVVWSDGVWKMQLLLDENSQKYDNPLQTYETNDF